MADMTEQSFKGNATKTLLTFINAARGKDETRPFTTEVYWAASKNCLVATDGRRLHMVMPTISCAQVTGLSKIEEDCFVALDTQRLCATKIDRDLGQFPDFMRVIPERESAKHRTTEPISLAGGGALGTFIALSGIPLNVDYLLPLGKTGIRWDVGTESPEMKAVRFDANTTIGEIVAVVMPMQTPDWKWEAVK